MLLALVAFYFSRKMVRLLLLLAAPGCVLAAIGVDLVFGWSLGQFFGASNGDLSLVAAEAPATNEEPNQTKATSAGDSSSSSSSDEDDDDDEPFHGLQVTSKSSKGSGDPRSALRARLAAKQAGRGRGFLVGKPGSGKAGKPTAHANEGLFQAAMGVALPPEAQKELKVCSKMEGPFEPLRSALATAFIVRSATELRYGTLCAGVSSLSSHRCSTTASRRRGRCLRPSWCTYA
jgi:hypothetical protein